MLVPAAVGVAEMPSRFGQARTCGTQNGEVCDRQVRASAALQVFGGWGRFGAGQGRRRDRA